MNKNWSKNSWRKCNIRQQPIYDDAKEVVEVEEKIKKLPPLVFAGEVRSLKKKLQKELVMLHTKLFSDLFWSFRL